MNKALIILIGLLFSICSFAQFNLDKKVTVSGLSSGAYMAGQVLVAHSSIVEAAAIIAGGPYYCSDGKLNTAMFACMETYMQGRTPAQLADITVKLASKNYIDPVKNLKNAKVYVLAGKNDRTVSPRVTWQNVEYFNALGLPKANLLANTDLNAGHNFPTLNQGTNCSATDSPFIGNCNYDVAGQFLNHFYHQLKPRSKNLKDNYYRFRQPEAASMGSEGVAYIPQQCLNGKYCKMHLSFHGCKQAESYIGANYYTRVGINEWATNNDLVIIYPQAVKYGFDNPNACWDWWGYSGRDFAFKSGSQITAVKQIIQAFQANQIQLKKAFK